jgi:DNA-binding response OmpR family regulator
MLERIMYIDDDETLTELAAMMLEVDGFEVHVCSGGAEVL